MVLQGWSVVKILGTELALVWPLLGVGQLVALEGAGLSEGLGAMLTCMGLLPCMDYGVSFEGTSCSAGIVTHLATERFFPCCVSS